MLCRAISPTREILKGRVAQQLAGAVYLDAALPCPPHRHEVTVLALHRVGQCKLFVQRASNT